MNQNQNQHARQTFSFLNLKTLYSVAKYSLVNIGAYASRQLCWHNCPISFIGIKKSVYKESKHILLIKEKKIAHRIVSALQKRRCACRTLQNKTYSELSILNYQLSIKPAFTLIEIMVVMLIMAVVMALGVTGWLAITKTAHTNNTRMILSELSAISTDYHARTGSYVFMDDDTSGSMYSGNNEDSINRFISKVKANSPKSAELFSNLNSKFYDNSKKVVKDSWGQYIRYTTIGYPQRGLPRRISAQKAKRDDERPYFASAGPDGKWGRVTDKGKLVEGAKDNIYSFNLKSHKNEGGR